MWRVARRLEQVTLGGFSRDQESQSRGFLRSHILLGLLLLKELESWWLNIHLLESFEGGLHQVPKEKQRLEYLERFEWSLRYLFETLNQLHFLDEVAHRDRRRVLYTTYPWVPYRLAGAHTVLRQTSSRLLVETPCLPKNNQLNISHSLISLVKVMFS